MTDEPPDPHDTPELDARERAALDAWTTNEPPDGFADRVLTARATAPASGPMPVPVAPHPARRAVGFAVVAALAVGAIAIVVTRTPDVAPSTGARAVVAREEIRLGKRGVAVAEAGAALSWQIGADGTARVDQSAGDVFYRIDHGGRFVVATPAGDVRVTGTCFRVEIQPMKPSKSAVIGGAIGAVIAATVVVTVYEGGIVVAGAGGAEKRATAGDKVVLGGDGPPVVAVGRGGGGAPPSLDASRDDLLARDAEQRETIAQLSTKVAGLEQEIAAAGGGRRKMVVVASDEGGGGGPDDDGDDRPFFDPSPELLADWAEHCHIRYDIPPIDGSTPWQLPDSELAGEGLEPGERDIINATLREIHQRWNQRLTALYIEATGDEAGAEALSPSSKAQEIQDKAAPGEASRIRGKMARERAGLEPVPADLSQTTPLERYLRGVASLGDEMQRLLADDLGPDRARALRELNDGWGHKSEQSGCDDVR